MLSIFCDIFLFDIIINKITKSLYFHSLSMKYLIYCKVIYIILLRINLYYIQS